MDIQFFIFLNKEKRIYLSKFKGDLPPFFLSDIPALVFLGALLFRILAVYAMLLYPIYIIVPVIFIVIWSGFKV